METKIGAFDVRQKLHESRRSIVFRAFDPRLDRPVILKVLNQDFPSPEELARYHHEFEIMRSLRYPEAISPIELIPHLNTALMVIEDFGAEALNLIARRRRFSVEEALALGAEIARQLGSIHDDGVIHRDINPSNIVLNEETGALKVIDFGISSRDSDEGQGLENLSALAGTLAYISPEQTGRVNRPVDARSDFYALGATLYELLTGQPPFRSAEPAELVFCHLARSPRPPHELNPEVPEAASRVVLKLLAKMAEERYQSAHGIRFDLECVLDGLRGGSVSGGMALGARDVPARLLPSDRLYGREREVAALFAAFERAARGGRKVLIVSGYSGVGKTSVILELEAPVIARRGLFARGKFEELPASAPASALIVALRSIVHLLLAEDEASLAAWRTILSNALGPSGRALIDVLPDLERIVGPQPPLEEVGPAEVQARFAHVFRSFIRALSSEVHPLVLFLDDLQWADDASRRLIELLATDDQLQHFLLIGAVRESAREVGHPLDAALERMASARAEVEHIHLAPLGLQPVVELLGDALSLARADVEPLARAVLEKTAGNPLFVHQFLQALERRGLVRFDPARLSWQFDLPAIEALSFTDNVVELLSARLAEFPRTTQQALATAALLGGEFDLRTLAVALDRDPPRVLEALQPALRGGALLPKRVPRTASGVVGAHPAALGTGAGNVGPTALEFRFAHDRVQEAARRSVPAEELECMHLSIGRLLRDDGGGARDVFSIVAHMNRARPLIRDPVERLGLAALNLEAGERALAAQSAASASVHFGLAIEDLGDRAFTEHPDLAHRAHLGRAKAEVFGANLELAEQHLRELIPRAGSRARSASAFLFLTRVLLLSARYEAARDVALEGLALFDLRLPADLGAAIGPLVAEIQAALGTRSVESLVEVPLTDDPEVVAIIDLWGELANIAFVLDPTLLAYGVLRVVALSLERGFGPASPGSLAFFGLLMGQMTGNFAAGLAYAKVALEVASRHGFSSGESDSCLVYGGYLGPWAEPIATLDAFLERGYQAGLAAGVPKTAAYNLNSRLMNAMFRGVSLSELMARKCESRKFVASTGNVIAIDLLDAEYLAISCLVGETRGPESFALGGRELSEYLSAWARHGSQYATCVFYIERGFIRIIRGEPALAREDLDRAAPLLRAVSMNPILARHAFLSTLAQILTARTPAEVVALEPDRARLRAWATTSPANFRHMVLFIDAEVARGEGEPSRARGLYEEAIDEARTHGFIHHEALIHERMASLLFELRKDVYAKLHLLQAKSGFERWGARFKVAELEEQNPAVFGQGRGARLSLSSLTSTGTTSSAESSIVDAISVVKASQSIAGEIVLDRLLRTLMQVVLENAGAQRGALFLTRGDRLVVEAEVLEAGGAISIGEGTALEAWSHGPRSVVHYVKRTLESVVVGDATRDARFYLDPYIRETVTRSLLGMPIVKQDRLIGVLYLENDLTIDAFTRERTEVLGILAGQMAVSLENASLLAGEHEARAAAERAVRLRDDFLVVASHELNTPMTSLLFLTQGLLRAAERGLSGPAVGKQLELLDRQVKHLTRLIGELLDVSRIEAGKFVIEPGPFDLTALVYDLVSRLELDFARAGITVSVDADGPVVGRWDRSRLEQVVTNLLVNAIKFGDGQPVEVHVGATEAHARLSVKDHGIGVAPEDQKRIFERFERAVSTTHFGGLGLGLFLSRSIVEAHGGRIGIESAAGRGARFWIELPMVL